ncbi:class I SAM-dependent methyltransferase [Brevibacterium pityocampae]|uniref:Class I SAM-dependent methyltransferase n=1 Tax=Brevibacterium pityocampae TaxID=506594 RepID=A0ABP8JUC4_9MICO
MSRNWFEAGAEGYSRFRPSYPPALASHLAEATRRSVAAAGTSSAGSAGAGERSAGSADTRGLCALDVGCGTGQLTVALAAHLPRVIGADPSADQLSRAAAHPRIDYVQAPAERLPAPDASVHLVTAAQAAHWFDLPAFYAEVRRIAAPGALLALITYGVIETDPDIAARVDRFYSAEIGRFWPPERHHVDAGYRTLDFPFAEVPLPPLAITGELTCAELLGYVSTWSAVRAAHEAGREALLRDFAADLRALWGDPARTRTVRWPISGRLGTV